MSGHALRSFYNGDKPDGQSLANSESYVDREIRRIRKQIAEWKAHPIHNSEEGEEYGLCCCYVPGIGCMDMVKEHEEHLAYLIRANRIRCND